MSPCYFCFVCIIPHSNCHAFESTFRCDAMECHVICAHYICACPPLVHDHVSLTFLNIFFVVLALSLSLFVSLLSDCDHVGGPLGIFVELLCCSFGC